MEDTIKKFLDDLIESLKRENDVREGCSDKKQVDIPYIISPMTQHLKDVEFTEFINDIENSALDINYEDYEDGWLGYGKIIINIYKEKREDDDCYGYTPLDYTYIIKLTRDQRHWGYCQCCPTDEDYIEDKECCGHGCDWSAPAFILTLICVYIPIV